MFEKKNDSLAQLCNRVEESYLIKTPIKTLNEQVEFKKKQTSTDGSICYKEIILPCATINTSQRNQWFLTNDKEIYKFEFCQNSIVYARKIVTKNDLYALPISSGRLDIFVSNGKLSEIVPISVSVITNKIFAMNLSDQYYFSSMRHSVFRQHSL